MLTFRTLERSKDEHGRLVHMRRFYWNRRRIQGYFSLEHAAFYPDSTDLKTHEVTLFGIGGTAASFFYDRKTKQYYNADTGQEFDTLRNAVKETIGGLE